MIIFYSIPILIVITISTTRCNSLESLNQSRLFSAAIPSTTSPVVSAVLLECPSREQMSQANSDDDQKSKRLRTPCEQQLIVNIRVSPSFHIKEVEKFLILEEVYDPRKHAKAKVMSPYLIEISRGEPVMMYPLEFSKTVKCESCELPKPPQEKFESEQVQKFNKMLNHNAESNTTEETIGTTCSSNKGTYESNISPEQESLRRVIEKISLALAPTTKLNTQANCNDSYEKKKDLDSGSLEELFFTSESTKNVSNNGIEESNNEDLEDSTNGVQSSEIRNDAYFIEKPQLKVGYFTTDARVLQGNVNDDSEDNIKEHQAMANVGIDGKLVKRLKQRSQMAQLGFVNSRKNLKTLSTNNGTVKETEIKKSSECNSKHKSTTQSSKNVNPLPTLYAYMPRNHHRMLSKDVKENNAEDVMQKIRSISDINHSKTYEIEDGTRDDSKNFHYDQRLLTKRKKPGRFKTRRKGKHRPHQPYSSDQRFWNTFQKQVTDYDDNTDVDYEVKKSQMNIKPNKYHEIASNSNNVDNFYDDNNIQKENFDIMADMKNSNDVEKSELEDWRLFKKVKSSYGNDQEATKYNKKNRLHFLQNKDFAHKTDNDLSVRLQRIFNRQLKKCKDSFQFNEPAHLNENTNPNSNDFIMEDYNGVIKRNDIDSDKNNIVVNEKDFFKIEKSKPIIGNSVYHPHRRLYNTNLYNNNPFRGDERRISNTKFNHGGYSTNNNDFRLKQNVTEFNDGYFESKRGDQNDTTHWNDFGSENNFRPQVFKFYTESPSAIKKKHDPNKKRYEMTSGMSTQKSYDANDGEFQNSNIPYTKIINNPHLNTCDKFNIMNIVHPPDKRRDYILNKFGNEVEGPLLADHIAYPSPIAITAQSQSTFKKKRSSFFYDDLEMGDALTDSDESFDNILPDKPLQPRHIEEGVQRCTSCGGKGKKAQGKHDSFRHVANNACRNCRNQCGNECNCDSMKFTRSVSDTWYSVFNMNVPLPFLTTKIRIFRKRQNTWRKIVPSITLNSLSGIFANANLSILFSSHVDIFQLEKSLRLQNHQLLIPKDEQPFPQSKETKLLRKLSRGVERDSLSLDELNMNTNSIFAIDSNKIDLDILMNSKEKHSTREKKNSKLPAMTNSFGVYTIGDLGYFPSTMNLIQKCPNDEQRLCLNILDDRVPAYSIKVKMPFRENALIHHNSLKVKIARIATDATTKNALQVSVDVINEGFAVHEFAISVTNCPLACAASKKIVQKFLLPHISETISYLLPLILESNLQHKRIICDVIVQSVISNNNKTITMHDMPARNVEASEKCAFSTSTDTQKKANIIARRQLLAEPGNRCFCVWKCSCYCIPKLETPINFDSCKKLSHREQNYAGLFLNCQSENDDDHSEYMNCADSAEDLEENINFAQSVEYYGFLQNALLLLTIALLLGLLKAIVGILCSEKVNVWGHGFVKPNSDYGGASRCRKFLVNIIFFIVFPFLCLCKCFTPSAEDLMVASTDWQCNVIAEHEAAIANGHFSYDDYHQHIDNLCGDGDDDDEDIILSQHIDRHFLNDGIEARLTGGENFEEVNNRLCDFSLNLPGVEEEDNDEDEEANTRFILQALVESRESLKKLLHKNANQQDVVVEEHNQKMRYANELVQTLKVAQIVYRTFDSVVGNVYHIPQGFRYSIQGYFLPSLGTEYEFVNYNPLMQHLCFSADGHSLVAVRPPVMLCPKEFSRTYANKLEVLEANDLSVQPPENAPCINITAMASVANSVAKLAMEQHVHSNMRSLAEDLSKDKITSLNYQVQALNNEEKSMDEMMIDERDMPADIYNTGTADSIIGIERKIDNKESSQTTIDDSKQYKKTYKCNTIYE